MRTMIEVKCVMCERKAVVGAPDGDTSLQRGRWFIVDGDVVCGGHQSGKTGAGGVELDQCLTAMTRARGGVRGDIAVFVPRFGRSSLPEALKAQ